MATSGSKSVAFTSWDTLKFSWWVDSQSIANNTTTIGWKMELVAGSSGRISASSTCPWDITVNGKAYSGSVNVGISNNTTKTLASGTTTISHNSDGSKTFSYSFNQYFGITFSSEWITDVGDSDTGTLPTIPRTSTPTVSASSVDMGGKVTVYTNRAATSLTHDLAYSFAGGSYVTFATGVGDSYAWTTPDLASSIPNTTSGTVTIRCTTKSGSTSIGTSTVTMTLKVPASVVPTISAVSIKEATDGIAARFGAYVQHKSTLNVSITAAGVKGSTISSYRTYVAGLPYDGAAFTTGALAAGGSIEVVANVTDSRGRTSYKSVTVTVLPYSPPAVSEFKAFRCDADGSPKDDGVYLGMSYAYSVTSLGGKNTAAMAIEYKTEASREYENTLATGSDLEGSGIRFFSSPTFSTDYQFNVRMTVTDWFGATTFYVVTLPTADVVLDFSSDGKGLGIGKVSQREDATEFARTLYDKFDTLIGNGLAAYTGGSDGNIDADTTLEHLVVTSKNTPTTEFWYVTTQFYSTKSATANRVQYALPYGYTASIYMRVYYNGWWQAWTELPILTGEYDDGTWHVRMWSDGWVELDGTYEISGMDCKAALGTWYRTNVFTPGYFPVELENPTVMTNYESAGYGAVLWATTEATSYSTPSYYLIRPTSTTIASGKVKMHVTGRMLDPGV